MLQPWMLILKRVNNSFLWHRTKTKALRTKKDCLSRVDRHSIHIMSKIFLTGSTKSQRANDEYELISSFAWPIQGSTSCSTRRSGVFPQHISCYSSTLCTNSLSSQRILPLGKFYWAPQPSTALETLEKRCCKLHLVIVEDRVLLIQRWLINMQFAPTI